MAWEGASTLRIFSQVAKNGIQVKSVCGGNSCSISDNDCFFGVALGLGSSDVLLTYRRSLLNEAKNTPEWSAMNSAAIELMKKERQLQLRHIAREIDYALAAIELMRAFPGRCELCPV